VGFSLIRSKSVGGGCDHEVMTGDDQDGGQHDSSTFREAVADARREAAAALARLAEAAVRYADGRIAEEITIDAAPGLPRLNRPEPGEFVADELSLLLRDQPYAVRCLLVGTRRLATGLPIVWEAFQCGEVDAEQIRVIDRVARRVTEAATLAAIDDQVIDAARTPNPETTPRLAAAIGGAAGAARLRRTAPPRISRTPRHRGTRRRRPCSPGSSPTITAGSSIPPNSAATPPPD
jgi:hypothetical protein